MNPEFEKDLYEKIIKFCRKGNFIYVQCESKPVYKIIYKYLKNNLYYGRGIFYNKGVVVLVSKEVALRKILFDKYYKIIKNGKELELK